MLVIMLAKLQEVKLMRMCSNLVEKEIIFEVFQCVEEERRLGKEEYLQTVCQR